MAERVPSIFILVPGPWRDTHEVLRALQSSGVSATASQRARIEPHAVRVDVVEDADFGAALRWGRSGPLPEPLLTQIRGCSHAALIECGFRLDESPRELARIGRALRDAGGVALRMEASGSASAWEPWLARLESDDGDQLYSSAVLLVGDDGDRMFTCGMHHFDLPDAEIDMADSAAAMAWLDAFCVYQIVEQPVLVSGHTFRPDTDAVRRTIERWPDHRHHPDDGRHNPFGVWRFLAPGAHGIAPTKTTPVIMPPLVTLLLHAERAAKRPLSRAEVEELTSNAPAIAMDTADIRRLERSRGYADIEPERAWDQWQLVRENLGV